MVGDTPESVEWRGMQHLLGAVGGRLGRDGLAVYAPDGSGAIQGWGRCARLHALLALLRPLMPPLEERLTPTSLLPG